MRFPCPLCCVWECESCGHKKVGIRWENERQKCPKCKSRKGKQHATIHREMSKQLSHLEIFIDLYKLELENQTDED